MPARISASKAASGTTSPSGPSLLTPKTSCPDGYVLTDEEPSSVSEIQQGLRKHAKHQGNRKAEANRGRGEELGQHDGRPVGKRLLEEHQDDDPDVVVGRHRAGADTDDHQRPGPALARSFEDGHLRP